MPVEYNDYISFKSEMFKGAYEETNHVSESRKELEWLPWLADGTVFRQEIGLAYKVCFQEAYIFSWLSNHGAVWQMNRINHPPNLLRPLALF